MSKYGFTRHYVHGDTPVANADQNCRLNSPPNAEFTAQYSAVFRVWGTIARDALQVVAEAETPSELSEAKRTAKAVLEAFDVAVRKWGPADLLAAIEAKAAEGAQ